MKLCSFVSPAEELAQKDDLQLLFSAITSWCPPYNLPWRKSAGEVLMTISRHGLSVNVVKYIHGWYNIHKVNEIILLLHDVFAILHVNRDGIALLFIQLETCWTHTCVQMFSRADTIVEPLNAYK